MRRSCALHAVSTSVPYECIVVGGGVSGCLLAGRLAEGNVRVALLERGPDPRKEALWHTRMAAAPFFHRLRGDYVAPLPLSAATPPGAAEEGQGGTAATAMVPRVLGGDGVVGSRAWVYGAAGEWESTPWDFSRDVAAVMARLENCASPTGLGPHRGAKGRLTVMEPSYVHPFYAPFAQSLIDRRIPLRLSFISSQRRIPLGFGRAECFMDLRRNAQSTLTTYLERSVALKRPIDVVCNAEVTRINTSGNAATGVQLADGRVIEGEAVFLCAGAVESSRLLLRSCDAALLSPSVGHGLWVRPRRIIQAHLPSSTPSMLCFASAALRVASLGLWRWYSDPVMDSLWDDVRCYLVPPTSNATDPTVCLTVHPYAVDGAGKPVDAPSACEISVELLQPASRGTVTEGAVDAALLRDADDRATMDYAELLARDLMASTHFRNLGVTEVTADADVGAMGGTLATAIDGTGRVVGLTNVFAGGKAILPANNSETLPITVALSEVQADAWLNVQESHGRRSPVVMK